LFISSPRCIIWKQFAKITGRYLYISFEAPKRKRKSRVCDSYWSTMRPYAVMKMDRSMELKTSSWHRQISTFPELHIFLYNTMHICEYQR
jgi:hypothetical protein